MTRTGSLLVLVAVSIAGSLAVANERQRAAIPESGARWLLHQPPGGSVVFKGIPDMDSAGLATGSILYPGDSAVGFLAAVFTHAAIADSAQDKQKAERQAEADKVLIPYRPTLLSFTYDELINTATPMMTTEGYKALTGSIEASDDWLVLSDPVFSMTGDQQAIVLDSTVRIYAPGQRSRPTYRNHVRVVSLPAKVEDPVAHWTGENGDALKKASAALFARALDAAIADAGGQNADAGIAKRTFRYMEGGIERIERAQLLQANCVRMLLRTLRGHLYLVPASNDTAALPDMACEESQARSGEPLQLPSS